jgi:transcription-repair coupling factor (superfamily II helicase)
MTLSGLLAALGAERSFANLRTQAGLPPGERSAETVISAPDGMRAVLTAQLRGALDDAPVPADSRAPVLLAVTATGRESEDLAAALGAYLPA